MYTLVRNVRTREGLLTEAPSCALAFVTAEWFYKFHSFTLECACFLATWFAFSAVFSLLTRRSPATQDITA